MEVLQHYYTSFVNKANGNAGFQVKAMSRGISSDIETAISRMIAYRIPSSANEYDIASHPVALRYAYRGNHTCIFLCSQSNGSDENGRPGNFFAHTLVMDADMFTSIPPIFYWRSPFWQLHDTEQRTDLPALPAFDVEPTLDLESIWEFLAQAERLQQFYKLLCAVIHVEKTQRRIVIIDTADHVALWIAAVSCVLPPDYRPLLSFSTYHHDPYQAQFMLTGTTSASSFRATAEEYRSYFILNTETGMMSSIEDSPYAALATEAANDALYETRLLPFFTDVTPRFPTPTCIDERLDLMTLYARIITPPYPENLVQSDLDAIAIALTTFEHQRIYTQDDLNELHRLGRSLLKIYKVQQDLSAEIYTEYERIRAILRDKEMPTDEFILDELKHFSGKIVRGETPVLASDRIARLRQSYGDKVFFAILRRSDYWQWLKQFLKNAHSDSLQRLWKYAGAYIQPDDQGQWIVAKSLYMINILLQEKRLVEEQDLLEAMKDAMLGNEKEWLKIAIKNDGDCPEEALKYFYYYLVFNLPIEQRAGYRAIIQQNHENLIEYEVMCDVRSSVSAGNPEKGLATLEHWIRYAQTNRYTSLPLLKSGMSQLQQSCSTQQWAALAPRILTSAVLLPLPPNFEQRLIQIMLANLSFSQFSPRYLELYKKYQDAPSLPAETRTVLASLVALADGSLNPALSERLYQYMKTLDQQTYKSETSSFITEFFKRDVNEKDHKLMIQSLLVRTTANHQNTFWALYQDEFTRMLIDPSRIRKAIALLALWFAANPKDFYQPYLPQSFFLRLTHMFSEAKKVRSFSGTIQEFATQASKQPWYPLIQDCIERRNAFTAVGQMMGQTFKSQWQRLRPGQNLDVQKQERQAQLFEEKIAELFEGKKALAHHEKYIPDLYSISQRSLFWSCYWQKFNATLLTQDAEYTLDIFSFWFDKSFNIFLPNSYIVQDFFLCLPEGLESVRKEREYREAVAQIDAIALKQRQERYGWYPLLIDFIRPDKSRLH